MQWIKIDTDITDDPKFGLIARQTKTRPGDVVMLWLRILCKASTNNGDAAGFNMDLADYVLKLKSGKSQAIIAAMQKIGLLDDLRVVMWAKWQSPKPSAKPEPVPEPAPKSSSYERVKRHRNKKRDENAACNADDNASVTHDNAACNEPLKDKIKIKTREEILNPPYPPAGGGARRSNSLPALRALMQGFTQNPDLLAALEDFRQMRERIRKPLTAKALELIFKKLDELAHEDPVKVAILEQSILNSWQGVFELNAPGATRAAPKSFSEIEREKFEQQRQERFAKAAEYDRLQAQNKGAVA